MSGRMSTKTVRAPRSANAFAVDTNVNDGTMTSSPGCMSSSSAAISSACVHDVVSSTVAPWCTSHNSDAARLVMTPSPDRWPEAKASATRSSWPGAIVGRLNGIIAQPWLALYSRWSSGK